MLESILSSSTSTTTTITLIEVILTIGVAFIVGGIISTTYMKTQTGKQFSQSFALTMILLPAIIAIIIMLIGSDIAKAFSLAGAFSIIRFRSAPGDPKDIAFVLFAMAAGLAAGVGVYVYALIFTIVLCFGMYMLRLFNFGAPKTISKQLQITVPEDLDYEEVFEDVLKQYTSYYELKRVKTSNLGSLFQLTYDLELLESQNTKVFLDDLRCRNGNLNISLHMVTDQSAY